jgi:hypothetical protein
MCMCGKPTLNGEPGYSWDGKRYGVRPVDPPALQEGDELVYDEPGRCGGLDSHCHHLRVVKARYGGFKLRVRHGGGDEQIDLGSTRMAIDALSQIDSDSRYWLLLRLYHVQNDAARQAAQRTAETYRQAFIDGRLKKRKMPGRDAYKITLESERIAQ